MYYLGSRYYDPKIARFLQQDDPKYGDIEDPLSLNAYTYGHNNPIRYYDYTGHAVTEWDRFHLTGNEIKQLEDLTRKWTVANASGDKKAMDSVHAQAESIRSKYRASDEKGTSSGNTVKDPAPLSIQSKKNTDQIKAAKVENLEYIMATRTLGYTSVPEIDRFIYEAKYGIGLTAIGLEETDELIDEYGPEILQVLDDLGNATMGVPIVGGSIKGATTGLKLLQKIAVGIQRIAKFLSGADEIGDAAKLVNKVDDAYKAVTKGNKAIVIGERMEDVKTIAKQLQAEGINAKWYQAWSKNFSIDRPMTPDELKAALSRNEKWIKDKIRQGYDIYDAGVYAKRTERSAFYELEQKILQKNNYPTIDARWRRP